MHIVEILKFAIEWDGKLGFLPFETDQSSKIAILSKFFQGKMINTQTKDYTDRVFKNGWPLKKFMMMKYLKIY